MDHPLETELPFPFANRALKGLQERRETDHFNAIRHRQNRKRSAEKETIPPFPFASSANLKIRLDDRFASLPPVREELLVPKICLGTQGLEALLPLRPSSPAKQSFAPTRSQAELGNEDWRRT
jgi:hypothetical protein